MLARGWPQRTLHSLAVKTCGACGATNADDARFCSACGASLIRACPRCGSEVPEGARFCPACGSPVGEPTVAPSGQERRIVTILFADVTGSTGLAERLDPERLQEIMASYFLAMRRAIEAEGGTVEKFIGDAVMAAFGVPTAHEDDPSRAVRAALAMRRALEELNRGLEKSHGLRLDMRVGVNTGEVLAAISPRPGEPMVTGDAVNTAARLEQTAEPGQVVIAQRTARAARGFHYRELGPKELRGKERPVPAVVLEEESSGRPERGIPGLRAPMVGRDEELALLQAVFHRAASEGRPNLVTIYGDAGVGKSRLTGEFLTWAESLDAPPTVVRGRCLPYGEGITYWPLAEILKARSGVLDTDPPHVVLDRIREMGRELLTEEVAPDPAKATAALAYTVGVEDPMVPFQKLEPREVKVKTHGAWRSFFSALAGSAPVLAVIEDIHWADPALLDLLEELAERVRGPAVFVCPARPELTERRPGWGGGRRNFSSVTLEPLSVDDADRLVSLLLSIDDLPETVHHQILERAEGNPFFLEEIIRKLIDEGRIVRDNERWRAASDIGEIVVPDTVQAVLAARIDLLDPKQKRTLQSAAVVGRVFWPGPVLRLLNGESPDLDDTLAKLEDRELVQSRLGSAVSGQREFVFKHVLTRDVAYESLPRRDRALAHSAVAEWIESMAGERRGEFAELLAYHYEEAHRGRRDDARSSAEDVERLRKQAFSALMQASEDARRRSAVDKAAALADRALAVARDPIERALAFEQTGMVALNDYRGDLAWSSFRDAAELRAEHVPADRMAIARVCARAVEAPMRWPGSMTRVPPEDDVRRYLELGFSNVGDADSEEHVRLLFAAGFVPFAFGTRRVVDDAEAERAAADGNRAADMAMRIGRPDLASASLDGISATLWPRGLYGSSLPIIGRRLHIAETLEDPWELGDIHAVAAWAYASIGDYSEAVRLAERGQIVAAGEAPGMTLHSLSWLSFAQFALGRWPAVIDEILPKVRAVLGERRDDPPYFAVHAFGSAAFVRDARGDPQAPELISLLRRQSSVEGASHLPEVWLAWILARQGARDEVKELLERVASIPSQVGRPIADQVRAAVLAEHERWDEVPAFLQHSRDFAARGGLWALPIHLDRLEGRAALAAGETGRAMGALARASTAFEALGARWEKACTDLSLAEALMAADRTDEARERLHGASEVFEDLRSLREIERSRQLLKDLES
jgi:class 3 adenylate cyclase